LTKTKTRKKKEEKKKKKRKKNKKKKILFFFSSTEGFQEVSGKTGFRSFARVSGLFTWGRARGRCPRGRPLHTRRYARGVAFVERNVKNGLVKNGLVKIF